MITSAIRALGNQDDPLSAFAGSLLQDVLQDSGLAESGRASQTATISGTVEPGHPNDPSSANGQPEGDWLGLSSIGSGNSGLRLSPGALAEFQNELQAGIDRVAADPRFDATRYAQERFAERLAEDHLPGPWDSADEAPIWLAGRPVPRTPPQATAGQGLQVGTNQRAIAVFNALTNAPPGEAFGLIPAAYRDIRFAAPLLSESRLLGEIERMRTLLGQSGIDATPVRLGAVQSIDANGRIGFDSVDVAERYANAIRLLELRRQGVVELDISTFKVTSVGTARIAPDVLIRNVEERYQAAFAAGFQEAEQRLAAGERLRYPVDMPQQLQIGLEADRVAKVAVGVYLRSVGVPEGPGQTVALNRWAYDQTGSGLFVRQDVLFDFGPNHRHWIDGKSSFANSGVVPQQLRSFFDYTGSQSGTIATPGGSINVRAPRGRP